MIKEKFLESFSNLFIELHSTNNLLTFLVRGHLYCESTLSQILQNSVKRKDAINIDRLDYQAKINLCNAFGLIPESIVPGLQKLGSIRNKYVHNIDYEVTEEDQLDFVNTLKSTLGEPAQYYLHYKTEFPNGFKRGIVVLWVPLQLELAPDKETASELLVSLAALMARVSGLEINDFIKEMEKRLKNFYSTR